MSPVSTFRICTVLSSPWPVWGSSWRVKERNLPSGDQEIGEEGELGGRTLGRLQEPEVKAASLSSVCGDEPDVRRHWRFCLEKIVVADFECVEVFLNILLVRWFIRCNVGNFLAAGPPRELFDW